MAYTNFIAAIDLGTSHMVGMVGNQGRDRRALDYCLRSREHQYRHTKRLCVQRERCGNQY